MIEVKTSTDGKALIVHSEYSLERLTPAAALELAARLKTTALRLLPPVTPEQVASFLHATYDGDERGLWEDSHP